MQPVPSSTLILLRDTVEGMETLLMRRHKKMTFMGGFWVFPGGVVEADDIGNNELSTARNAAVRETQEEAGLSVEASRLVAISRWITPEGAPKRFNTWFFIARADAQEVQVDGNEMTDCLWISPAEAIKKHHLQEMDMLPPTLISLAGLQEFITVAQALAFYREKEPRYFQPKVSFHNEQCVMLYHGDSGYASSNATEYAVRHRCISTTTGWSYINETGER